jgi:hypothetical protein
MALNRGKMGVERASAHKGKQPVHQPGGTFVCFLLDTERLPRRSPPSLQGAGGSSLHNNTNLC